MPSRNMHDCECSGRSGAEIEDVEADTDKADMEILNVQCYLDVVAAKQEKEWKLTEDTLLVHRCVEQLKFEKLQLEQRLVLGQTS